MKFRKFLVLLAVLILTCTMDPIQSWNFDGYKVNPDAKQVNKGQTLAISALLNNRGEADFSFLWIAGAGIIADTAKETITWTAPEVETTVTISVFITDRRGKTFRAENLVLSVVTPVEEPESEPTPQPEPYTLVTIIDLSLNAAIREKISKPAGNIFYKDVSAMTALDLSAKEIVGLKGLEYFTALTSLNLQNNYISELSPLSNLTGLTTLDLDSNLISDVNPLSTLTGLTELYLDDNQITDEEPLNGLTGLTKLYLNHALTEIQVISTYCATDWESFTLGPSAYPDTLSVNSDRIFRDLERIS